MSHVHTHEDSGGGVAVGMILGIVAALLIAALIVFLVFGGFGARDDADAIPGTIPGDGTGGGNGGAGGADQPSSMRYIVPDYQYVVS